MVFSRKQTKLPSGIQERSARFDLEALSHSVTCRSDALGEPSLQTKDGIAEKFRMRLDIVEDQRERFGRALNRFTTREGRGPSKGVSQNFLIAHLAIVSDLAFDRGE